MNIFIIKGKDVIQHLMKVFAANIPNVNYIAEVKKRLSKSYTLYQCLRIDVAEPKYELGEPEGASRPWRHRFKLAGA